MANFKITDKSAVTVPATTDTLLVDQGGVAKKETVSQILGNLSAYTGNIDTSGTLKADIVNEHTASTGVGIETQDGSVLRWKIISIGDWNMDTTNYVTVSHGLTLSKIRSVDILIIRDDGNQITSIFSGSNGANVSGGYYIDATTINPYRLNTGTYDDANYNSTSFNRGYITIGYID